MFRKSNKLRIGYIEGHIRELKFDIQAMEYAIEQAKKTKNPAVSLMRPRKAFIEILDGLKTNVKYILDEVKYSLDEEELWKYEDQLS